MVTAQFAVFFEQHDHGACGVERWSGDDTVAVREDPFEFRRQECPDHSLLGLEVFVDRRDTHVGGCCDLLERRARVALLVKQPRSSGEHRFAPRELLP